MGYLTISWLSKLVRPRRASLLRAIGVKQSVLKAFTAMYRLGLTHIAWLDRYPYQPKVPRESHPEHSVCIGGLNACHTMLKDLRMEL